ncbi:MAG: hypothetical protein K6E11_00250 [Bacilli bacterium]|nr:hypothetical protein [Bacilli bacterium]
MKKHLLVLIALSSLTLGGCKDKEQSKDQDTSGTSTTDTSGSDTTSGGQIEYYQISEELWNNYINGYGLLSDDISYTIRDDDESQSDYYHYYYDHGSYKFDYNGSIQYYIKETGGYHYYYEDTYTDPQDYGLIDDMTLDDFKWWLDYFDNIAFSSMTFNESTHAYHTDSALQSEKTYTNLNFYFENNIVMKWDYIDDEGYSHTYTFSDWGNTTVTAPIVA